MGDISNKSLAALLVVAIVVSVAGTWLVVNQGPSLLKVTGRQTDTGTASLTIQSAASIKFLDDAIAWGNVKVNTTGSHVLCYLDTAVPTTSNGTGCVFGYTAETSGLVIENDGNKDLTVNLNFSKTSADFMDGSNPVVKYKVGEGAEASSCGNLTGTTTYADFAVNNPEICAADNAGLSYIDSSDDLRVDIQVAVPYDATVEAKSVTVTVTGTQI